MSQVIKDDLGRSFKKLRLSLTNVCNFRCTYCMPENQKFKNHPATSPEDIFQVSRELVENGIDEIRLTGGEPLLYPHFMELVEKLSALPLKKLALTTNAFHLAPYLKPLSQTKLNSINISLDSLDEHKFHMITKSNSLKKVMDAIDTACGLGFEVKTNTVLLAGTTEEEIGDFVEFSKKYGIIVRFLEAMKIGVLVDNFKERHLPMAKVKEILKERYGLTSQKVAWDSTSQLFRLSNGARVGFIASESEPFCNSCSRLRVNHKLEIRPCLMRNESISLKGVKYEDYPEMLKRLLKRKPRTRLEKVDQAMFEIGG